MTIDVLLDAIATKLRAEFPELRECRVHEGQFDLPEIRRLMVASPAMLVSCLGVPRVGGSRGGVVELELVVAVFIACSGGKSETRARDSARLAQGVLVCQHESTWDAIGVKPPSQARAENLYSKEVDQAGVALWAVTWRQSIFTERV